LIWKVDAEEKEKENVTSEETHPYMVLSLKLPTSSSHSLIHSVGMNGTNFADMMTAFIQAEVGNVTPKT
jgi:hypothetical protein